MIGGLSVMAPERRGDVLARAEIDRVGHAGDLLIGAIVGMLHW